MRVKRELRALYEGAKQSDENRSRCTEQLDLLSLVLCLLIHSGSRSDPKVRHGRMQKEMYSSQSNHVLHNRSISTSINESYIPLHQERLQVSIWVVSVEKVDGKR
jgi:hypothetical protein